MNYIKALENIYKRKQKGKILWFASELHKNWEIDKQTLQDTYFYTHISKRF